jgi:hypothetical protein
MVRTLLQRAGVMAIVSISQLKKARDSYQRGKFAQEPGSGKFPFALNRGR